MKTLVLGMGNPILSDDGVGLYVARDVLKRIDRPDVTVAETAMAGLNLLDLLPGYDSAIIVDAIKTVKGKAGQVYRLAPDVFDATQHASSPHDVNFATALALGKRLGMSLPAQIVLFAIEVSDTSTFGEDCTPEVKKAIPICVDMIINELNGGAHARSVYG